MTRLQRCEHQKGVNSSLPDTFQTSHLLFYERFKAYQDYVLGNLDIHSYIFECIVMLKVIPLSHYTLYICIFSCVGDCKPSEVKAFTADYLEKVLEPSDWLAQWSTDVFDVLVEVRPTFIDVYINILSVLNS